MGDGDPIDYEHLSGAEREQIVDQRLHQYEAEHYGAMLNRRALSEANDIPDEDKRAQLEQLNRTIASLESSIRLHRSERDRIRGGG
jgi:hypothetical protein